MVTQTNQVQTGFRGC